MRTIRYYLPAVVWIGLILVLCALPGEDIPKASLFDDLHVDKIVHFALFGGIVVWLSMGYYRQKGHISNAMLILIALIASGYGLAIEYMQKYLVVGRSFDMWDVLADAAGAFAAIFVFKFVQKRYL
ncbi:VanZ family protein [Chitinophaga horti]|uniref:VanZ family protein n=1 Tax=Chitinophaga horti TaxID=2920382 RepID=A0ABY6J075_9BACT|nr:VanZ family protein [Chitinophaga horti]UYQ93068.1 VanZ family protein [Chitinophaga horti]